MRTLSFHIIYMFVSPIADAENIGEVDNKKPYVKIYSETSSSDESSALVSTYLSDDGSSNQISTGHQTASASPTNTDCKHDISIISPDQRAAMIESVIRMIGKLDDSALQRISLICESQAVSKANEILASG